jgi:hypothetical protein
VKEARRILDGYHGTGSVLAHEYTLRAIAILTVQPRNALVDLDVAVVCLPRDSRELVGQVGLRPSYRRAFSTHDAHCFLRRP